jgi:hypothetical protein
MIPFAASPNLSSGPKPDFDRLHGAVTLWLVSVFPAIALEQANEL